MKKIILSLMLFVGALFGEDELLINSAGAYSSVMKSNSAYKYLANEAEAVLIFPSVKKLGFIIGGMYGEGVIVYKGGQVSAVDISNASIGLQIGYEDNYLVIFVMSEAMINKMRKSQITLSGDATAVVGNYSADSGRLDMINKDMYVFTSKGGFFAGVSLGGSVIETKNSVAFDTSTQEYRLLMQVLGRNF
ncbi:lipid-binding SYLF domain-containing protein [Campylobacter sp. JMF_11 EL3]|uniref:lipid-binding SYLF domain-containing protein n=1 Tax=Campylobacter sp. JMF_11 EL3 TaxID=2983841 RepID=UPI0022E9B6BA|nr:lipid-binding SYLF domain-containing protein [Campylobacter sp. JMF_11 EL3]MDA3063651.1 lipid-binding SYLF domain-containing protein [Campylobacter sp. JMF_11 EL3]